MCIRDRGEVIKGADILRYYAEEGERVYGRIIPNAEANTESRVIYQPIGVAAAISPWNYPIELLAWKVGGEMCIRDRGKCSVRKTFYHINNCLLIIVFAVLFVKSRRRNGCGTASSGHREHRR